MKKSKVTLVNKFQIFCDNLEPKVIGKRKAMAFGLFAIPITLAVIDIAHSKYESQTFTSIFTVFLMTELFAVLIWLALEADTKSKQIMNGFLFSSLGLELTLVLQAIDQPPRDLYLNFVTEIMIMFFALGIGVSVAAHFKPKKKCPPIPSL